MGKKKSKTKVGRNSPCPCGSGKKLKKCHETWPSRVKHITPPPEMRKIINQKYEEQKAFEIQRKKQQGLGKPIISTDFKGQTIIAVGNEIHWSEKWKTFHDFLFQYIKFCFGKEWWFKEIKKESKHPILLWAKLLGEYTKKYSDQSKEINRTPMTGAVNAYLGLSYNLYLLAHNVELQSCLVHRLKNRDQFPGAYYETFVAAKFIQAGYEIQFEDETDVRRSHCEFTATHKETGKKFSVEAKARQGGDPSPEIGDQLYKALKKQADHDRVVFIELNSAQRVGKNEVLEFAQEISDHVRELEDRITINKSPSPSAYVILTNFPYQFNLNEINVSGFALAEGYKIPEFNFGLSYPSIRDALKVRKEHFEMFQLMDSFKEHSTIPSTFDGEIPELVDNKSRLRIGSKYLISNEKGEEVVAELIDATVGRSEVTGIYRLEDGRSVVSSCPLTEEELAAYRSHPDTFFGVVRKQGKKVNTPLDLFDFFYETYKKSPKEKLLQFMEKHKDIEKLSNLDHEELVMTFCERHVYAALAEKGK